MMAEIKKSTEAITIWFQDSGLSVNQTKAKICSFYKREIIQFVLTIDNVNITTKNEINIIGALLTLNCFGHNK
jgi:hypothetical protein